MNQKTLSQLTKIRPNTISKMYYEEIKRIDIKHIDSLCKAFDCEISELFEYIPTPTQDEKNIENKKQA